MFLTEKQKRLIEAKIPESLIHKKQDKFDYVDGATYIDFLNRIFDYQWSWIIRDHWLTEASGKQGADYVAHVLGDLTVFYYDEKGNLNTITKSGTGAQPIPKNSSAAHENAFKGADTDALKRAARNLGIYNELWRKGDYEQFIEEIEKPQWTEADYETFYEEFLYLKDNFSNLSSTEQNNLIKKFDSTLKDKDSINFSNIVNFVAFLKEEKKPKTIPLKRKEA